MRQSSLKRTSVLFLAAMSVCIGWASAGKKAGLPDIAGTAPAPAVASPKVAVLPDAAPDAAPVDPFAPIPVQAKADSRPNAVAPGDVAINDSGLVEIHVNDASLVEVLRMLSLQSQKNIVASKDVSGKVTANLYGVTVREALDALLAANGYAYREKGNFIYIFSAKEIADQEKAARQPVTEVYHVFYTPAANAVTMIKPVLSDLAQVSFSAPATVGIASSQTDAGGNGHASEDVIVVTDYPENQEKVKKVLKEVDRRPQQILIEATILRAALNEDNALGTDFTLLGGVDFASLTGVGATPADALSGNIVNNPNAGNITQNGYNAVGTGFTSQVPQGGLRVGLVHNNIAVFLQALESVTDTVILANPKVLALNKQRGEVIVGRKDGYVTTTVTETSRTQTVEFLDTGTRLLFRPFIGDDGFIRLEIHPEDSSGGLNSSQLPFKITTEVTSNVMVKDGHTVVIGGLFRESSTSSRGQVPFLGNIPLAGALFRQQRDVTTREEIIIMLTPHIVKDDVAYSQFSEEQLKEAEKLRVGVRKGMMPLGRERLAQSCYETAVKEMDKSSSKSALFWANCATNLNPKFIEASDLKQQITGKQIAEADSSTVRGFITRQIMEERRNPPATQKTPFSVPIDPPKDDRSAAKPSTTQPSLAAVSTDADRPSKWGRYNPFDLSRFYQDIALLERLNKFAAKRVNVTVTELPIEK